VLTTGPTGFFLKGLFMDFIDALQKQVVYYTNMASNIWGVGDNNFARFVLRETYSLNPGDVHEVSSDTAVISTFGKAQRHFM
jgi:hypothetical protein